MFTTGTLEVHEITKLHACTIFFHRKITVEDTSKKRLMDLRLLHGIAYGKPWFGRWGYKFSRGSFGVQEHHYQRAIEVISSLNLDGLLLTLPKEKPNVRRIISSYRELSNTQINTLTDLLKFMLTLNSQTSPNAKSCFPTLKSYYKDKVIIPSPSVSRLSNMSSMKRASFIKAEPTNLRSFSSVIATMDTRWPKRRLEYAADVIVNALKEHSEVKKHTTSRMTRQEVRDAARIHIGDTGLIDYVLKSMSNIIVGNYIVRRHNNTANKVLEYTIHKVGEISTNEAHTEPLPAAVYQDIFMLYNYIILDQPVQDISGLSVSVILDSKHFVKEWPLYNKNGQFLKFIFRVLQNPCEIDMELSKKLTIEELAVVSSHASIDNLKVAAQQALRDTYCMMEHYVVSDIMTLEGLIDKEAVFGAIESGSEVWVRGSGIDLKTELRYEVGSNNWKVRCSCGATDDDGELMVSCDVCEVWQHTICSGVEDSYTVPQLFVCQMCSSLIPPKTETISYLKDSGLVVFLQ